MAAFLGEIFFDRRAERFVGHRVQRALIAERGQFLVQIVHHGRRDETVLAGVDAEHRRLERFEVRLHVRVTAIKHHARADLGIERCGVQRQRASHAEPDRCDPLRLRLRQRGEIIDRAGQIARRLIDAHAHHQLSGFVGRFGLFAVIQVRRERDEPGLGEPIGDSLDVRHETPVFLNDHDSRPVSGRFGEIRLCRPAIRFV